MIKEVSAREKEMNRLQVENELLKKNMKTCYAIIRTPRLSELFHKAERKKLTAEEIRKEDKKAHYRLR